MTAEPNLTRREQVRADLIRRFQDCTVGSRLPSDRALAKELGVAYLTVNRVMHELAWEGYVDRRPRRGTFLASREKAVQNDLTTGTRPGERIAFAYPNYFSFATWTRLRSAEEQAVKRGLGLAEFKMNCDTSYENLCEFARGDDDLKGLIVIPVPGSVDRSTLALLDELDVPVVILAANEMVSLGRRVWSVAVDWYKTGYLMAEALVRLGHKSMSYVHNEPDAPGWHRMLRGMRRAVNDGKLRRRDLAVAGRGIRPWEDSCSAGYELTRRTLSSSRPTGLVFDSFSGAFGGLRAVREKGLRVPEDVSLVCDGGGNGQEEYTVPPLTTVDSQPGEEVRLAFECILGGAAASSRMLSVPPVLVERRSTARAPAARSGRRRGPDETARANRRRGPDEAPRRRLSSSRS